MPHSSLLTAILFACSLGMGCHLYLDDDHEREPDVREPRPDPEPCFGERCGPQRAPADAGYVTDGGIGDECTNSIQCGPGCYCTPDGYCEESLRRPDATIFACEALNTEEACTGNNQCAPVYRGINCTADDGSSCSSNSTDCQCESFAFDRCEDA